MKHQTEGIRTEVHSLLEEVVLAEVQEKLKKRLQNAMRALDPQTCELIEAYFSGQTIEQLSSLHGVSEPKIRDWIEQGKRKLNQELRKGLQIRQ